MVVVTTVGVAVAGAPPAGPPACVDVTTKVKPDETTVDVKTIGGVDPGVTPRAEVPGAAEPLESVAVPVLDVVPGSGTICVD